MNNDFTSHGMMIGGCVLVTLGLFWSHVEALWSLARDFFSQLPFFGAMFPNDEREQD